MVSVLVPSCDDSSSNPFEAYVFSSQQFENNSKKQKECQGFGSYFSVLFSKSVVN